jgi:hypothetical protein
VEIKRSSFFVMPGFMPGMTFVGGTLPAAASFRTPHRGDPESGNEKKIGFRWIPGSRYRAPRNDIQQALIPSRAPVEIKRSSFFVMPGFMPGIHVFLV